MTPIEYQRLAARTEAPLDKAMYMLNGKRQVRLLHGAMGCATESGELLDAIKKHIFYQKPLDHDNMREEIGDVLWYLAIICNEMDWRLEDIMELNIRKLRERYPEKFTSEKAIVRDLEAERQVLESK